MLTREQMLRQTMRCIAELAAWSCAEGCDGNEHDPECPIAQAREVLLWERALPVTA